MKKLITLLVSIAMFFSFAVPAFAKDPVISPENPTNYTITYYGVRGAQDGTTSSVAKGSTATVSSDRARGRFSKWDIKGNYSLISGGLTSGTITIMPESDITITATYTASSTTGDVNKNGKYDGRLKGGKGTTGNGYSSWKGNKTGVPVDSELYMAADADPSKGDCSGNTIYRDNGDGTFSPAVEGVDFDYINDTNNTTSSVRIIPYCDLVICFNYGGKITSPKTSDNSVLYVTFIALFALAGIAIQTKKILVK